MSDMEDEDQRGEKSRRKNPFDAASAVSKIIYSWGTYYLREGNKRELTEDDICEPMGCHKSILSEKNMSKAWDEEVHECKRKNRRPNLLKAIVRTYGSKFVVLFLLTVIQETIPFILIYFLNGLLQYFANPSDDPQLYRYALIDAFAVFFTIFMRSFLIHFILLQTSFMGMDIRVAVSTLLYQKVLRVSKAKKAIKSTGFIINLFANDGTKLERLFTFASLVIISPIQCVAASIVSWYIMGWPAAVAAFFSLACYPLQMWTGMSCAKARLEVAKKTDVRVRIMNEIISGIKVLKMYAWEESFSRLISAARWEEIKCLEKAIRIRYFGLMNIVYRTRTALFLLILLYVLYVGDISPVSLYVTSALLYLYQATLSVTFTKGCLFSKEAFLSLERITEFLLSAEHGDQDGQTETNPGNTDEENIPSSCLEVNGVESDQVISIKGMSAGWSAAQSTLSDVNLDFPRGELTAVVGAVGAGKSSLLLAILGEITVSEGSLCVSGSLSYAAQEPWVFQGTILENIVFGQKFDSNRYNEVIRVCALERDISMFPDGHSTTVGERGVMLSGGQKARVGLARAVYQKADAYLFDDPLSAVDVSVGELIFNDCIKGFLREKTVILVTHQIQILGSVERIVWLENGSVKDVGSYMDIIGTGYETGEGDQDEENDISCVNAEENICSKANNSHNNKISMESENKMFQAVGGTVMIYLKSGGSWWSIALLFFLYFSTQISGSFFDIWLNRWVNLEDHVHKAESELNAKGKIRNIPDTLTIALPPLLDVPTETCLIVLGISLMTLIILAVFSTFYVSHFLTRASSTLHNNMFDAVLRTAVGFFNNNTSGRILNRFSYELRIVDELLSDLLMESLTITLFLAGTFVLVAIINPLVIILIVVCFSAILYLKRVYVKTSSQLRRLESASRSPVFAHINQTLNGLTTVRAFGAQHYLTSEFYKYQDDNSGAQFLFTGLSLIFGYWVELISLVYSAGAIFGLFILTGSSMVAGNAGMVVTQIVAMSSLFQHVLKVIVEFENSLTSVERVFEYSKLPSEDNWKAPEGVSGDADGSTWPEHGKIQFKSVSFRHQAHGPRVLEDLNITIMPREKIGIVGRTGAGKSSMISALLRMAVVEGRIEIDDIDSSTVPLQILRSNISIIPQEPILFSGPLRRNIDPFEKYTDDIIWTALEEVELREVVSHLPNGLNFEISEGGENLSVGQKQLLCLARAIVRNNKILILDEATANVDHETDTLIQRTIRRKFMDKTVLTIAHRLNTVIDSDRVLVISHGNVVEFDHPHELLQNEIGHFREMVAKCGKSTENLLRKIAEEKEKWSFMRGWILPEDPRPRRDWNDFTNDTYQAYI